MTEYTPTPWEVKDGHEVVEPMGMTHIADCALNDVGEADTPALWRANAEYIVRCVNAHDELVTALEAVMKACAGTTYGPADALAEAALAKARLRGES